MWILWGADIILIRTPYQGKCWGTRDYSVYLWQQWSTALIRWVRWNWGHQWSILYTLVVYLFIYLFIHSFIYLAYRSWQESLPERRVTTLGNWGFVLHSCNLQTKDYAIFLNSTIIPSQSRLSQKNRIRDFNIGVRIYRREMRKVGKQRWVKSPKRPRLLHQKVKQVEAVALNLIC